MDTFVVTNSTLHLTNSTIIRDEIVSVKFENQPCRSCNTTEPSGTDTTVQNPLSINGGFIAMAAGLSVVIPLICVLIIQLRRAKREERERARVAAAASGGENGETQGPVNDPPPSYEQLFGPTHVSPVHSRNGSMDALIEENETGHSEEDRVRNAAARTAGASTDGVDGGGSRDDSQVPSATGPRSNPAFSSSSIATISGSQVTDDPVNVQHTQREASSERAPGSASLSNTTSSSTPESNSRQSTSLSSSTPPPPYSASRPSSSSSSSSLSSAASTSTSSASRSGSSSPPPPPPPPPPPQTPPPPFPSWSRRSNPNAVNNRQSSGELSRIGQTLRRLPGMHISIEDFFASLRGLYDNENDGPPPSYEEALKILESAKIAKEQEIK